MATVPAKPAIKPLPIAPPAFDSEEKNTELSVLIDV
jgi:hypothetical protein